MMKHTGVAIVIAVLIVSCMTLQDAFAGVVKGTVKDDKTGDKLVGANVRLLGTKFGATTNLDGEYEVGSVPPGHYSIRVFSSGYAGKVVTGVDVRLDDATKMDVKLTPINATSDSDATRIEDTYVTAERVGSTSAAILAQRQRASVIGDAISADMIARSPAATTSDALKRITGLAIYDNKWVFVRGVTDRYNTTMLNDVAVSSADVNVDKKSFAFDMIPASLLENTTVVKSASPDLPGDFSGGLVKLQLRNFPSERLLKAKIGYSTIESSTGEVMAIGPKGDKDWAARDDGTRALVGGGELTGVALAQSLPNNWAPDEGEVKRNGSYELAVGDRYRFGDTGQIGFIGSMVYKDGYDVEDFEQKPTSGGVPLFDFTGARSKYNVLWGSMLNLNVKPSKDHKISFENTYNRSAKQEVIEQFGIPKSADSTQVTSIEWNQRDLYLGKANGEHTLGFLRDLKVEWRGHYSQSDASAPDRKLVSYSRDPRGNYLMRENYRIWSEVHEKSDGFSTDWTYPFGDIDFKAGYLQNKRDREYRVDAFATDISTLDRREFARIVEPIDEIFRPENYGPKLFSFIPITVFTGEYDGAHDINSYYGMADVPFRALGQRFRFTGGARVEDSKQEVSTIEDAESDEPIVSTVDEKDVLPSANLTYLVTNSSNVRLGYFESVNRPEFREMAPVLYLDFAKNRLVKGNAALKRAKIKNYDVRFELFPAIDEVLAISYFYKEFENAIEEELVPSPDRYVQTWFNSPTGNNSGYEFEARKTFDFMEKPFSWLGSRASWLGWMHSVGNFMNNITFTGNYTKIKSEIEYEDKYTDENGTPITEIKTRAMQGQAPWMANGTLTIAVPKTHSELNLLYSKFGRRLDAVGETRDEDVYEEPRGVFDIVFAQRLTGFTQLKFAVKDITAEDVTFTGGKEDSVWERRESQTSYSLSISFNL